MKIFLSYGHDKNTPLVEKIKADLENRGHDVWIDTSEIKFGDDWRCSITDGILESDWMLSFLSQHSTRDPGVCLDELGIALGSKGGIVKTVLVEKEKDVKPPVSVSHVQWLDMSNWEEIKDRDPKDFEQWYKGKLDEIVRVVESESNQRFAGEIEELQQKLKPVLSDARIWGLLKDGFVGREWLFKMLEDWRINNQGQQIFWITGEPGIGKSALSAWMSHYGKVHVVAAQFVEHNKPNKKDPAKVVQSIAYQLATRLDDYRKFLVQLPVLDELDSQNAFELFENLLVNPLHYAISGNREPCIILIDALDEAVSQGQNNLVEFLSEQAQRLPDWIRLVVTSRPEPSIIRRFSHIEQVKIEADDNHNINDLRKFLRVWAENNKKNIQMKEQEDKIIAASEGNFLYLREFCRGVDHEWIDFASSDSYPQGMTGLYTQYFTRQFPKIEEFEKKYLPVIELVLASSQPLPEYYASEILGLKGRDKMEVLEPLGSLFPRHNDSIAPFHKSLKEWICDDKRAGYYYVPIEDGQYKLCKYLWKEVLRYEGESIIPEDYVIRELPVQIKNLSKNKNSLPNIIDESFKYEEKRRLIVHIGNKLVESGRWLEAEQWNDINLDLHKLMLGHDHPGTIYARRKLAAIFRKLGRYEKARETLEKVLEDSTRILGHDHPDTLTAMALLASTLGDLGKHEKAKEMQEKVLENRTRILDHDHRDTITAMGNLAGTLVDLGELEKAREIYEKVLEDSTRILSHEHPYTITARNDLAGTLGKLGEHIKAREMQEKVIEDYTRILGHEHPFTITARNNLATSLRELGEYEKAREMQERVVECFTKKLGHEHPDTITARNNLANTLGGLGKYEEAREIQEKVIEGFTKILGHEHPDTISAMNNLAGTLSNLGEHEKAREIQENLFYNKS
ncbi:TPR repeat-containing protein [Desulfonatronospira thiodismutans ASO3-1]|uniref:TPR repeat-containing protein n=1 Tax=Desulfonatronospira thiodismutans ASO3-1 TaxID=555779 RepID=D6SUU8_9BACT|nr:tetratricopeptide repeat protein [Desulfonatronospira thiodismutans]EFI33078.1 TPR repeat-containing protein [Desulfonatronospira thiodismutans ASO3-1]